MDIIKSGIKYTLDIKREAGFENERNDCTVRALSNVTGVPYRDAHQVLANYGRKQGHGMFFQSLVREWARAKAITFGYRISIVPLMQIPSYATRPTLAQTVRSLGAGRFVIIITGHALTVIDGVIHDAYTAGARCHVKSVYKFEASSVVEAREAALEAR